MKKLLSLLSVLTISGSAIPTTIAASPYQKEKNINNNINLQTNNLKNLIRNKKQDNEQDIFGILKIVVQTNGSVSSSGVALNNKVYFGSWDNNVYEYDPTTEQQKIVIIAKDVVSSPGLVLNNKIYFSSNDHNVYEYNPTTGKQKIVIKTNNIVSSSGLVLNNKIYFGSYDHKVYEYDPTTEQQKTVIRTNNNVSSSGVALNNKVYFGSWDNNVYEYDPFKLIESDIINIKEQIKKGLYIEYKKQNPNFEIKQISNINLENLILSDLTIEQKQKHLSSNLEENIGDNICPNFNLNFVNKSSIEQNQNTPSCFTQLTKTNTFQKMNGFSKSETISKVDNWSANVNTKVTAKASASAGIPIVSGGKVDVGVGGGYSWGWSQTYNIEDNSKSYDTEIKTTTNNITINIPAQSVKVPAMSKISTFITSWINNIQLILSYYQKVNGIVSADFIDKNNNNSTISISIKNAMINLQENNILPSKININNDDSINFYYDIKSLEQIIMHDIVILESTPLI